MRRDIEWDRMRAEYVASYRGKGGLSFAKLARAYGVSLATVERRAAREEWYRLRLEAEEARVMKTGFRVFREAIALWRNEGKTTEPHEGRKMQTTP